MALQRPTRIPTPHLIMGPCIVEIDRIVIRYVQYQFEVNRCRNEEFIVKGNFGWAWSMWVRTPQVEIDHIQFEVNRCRNEEVLVKGNLGWAWSMLAGRPRIDCIVIRDVQYQFEVNRFRNEEVNEIVARTDGGEYHNIPTLSKSVGITKGYSSKTYVPPPGRHFQNEPTPFRS
ncbi:hypothetical protein DPMN_006269 [Dreissena polymorpha]|uniref:Uncharacterized protein n=1 Tax=Dreissena polymorpha TaxID=45954 RepID=A0A9D4MUY2_DREPO|nr:hypothetical protein DPMN_006269 [Dreissena polymorpha]